MAVLKGIVFGIIIFVAVSLGLTLFIGNMFSNYDVQQGEEFNQLQDIGTQTQASIQNFTSNFERKIGNVTSTPTLPDVFGAIFSSTFAIIKLPFDLLGIIDNSLEVIIGLIVKDEDVKNIILWVIRVSLIFLIGYLVFKLIIRRESDI